MVEAWGFDYRTHAVWDKARLGMGYYFRLEHEDLLIARRGSFPVPDEPNRPETSIFRAKRGRHSEKPEIAYELLERMWPTVTRIELFARKARHGWAAWGLEAPEVAQ